MKQYRYRFLEMIMFEHFWYQFKSLQSIDYLELKLTILTPEKW